MIKERIKYFLLAGGAHTIHSPFVFQLYHQVFSMAKKYHWPELLALKKTYRNSPEVFTMTDLGAGGLKKPIKKVSLSQMAYKSSKKMKYAALNGYLAASTSSKTIIELGTCLGFTTAILSKLNPKATIYTFEGDETLARFAQNNFDKLGLKNIEIIQGNIDQTLGVFLQKSPQRIDFAFFDANHQYQPTLNYFDAIIKHSHEDSILVFDDIHWSAGMQQAWHKIMASTSTKICIDVYEMGLVFLHKKYSPQNFILKF